MAYVVLSLIFFVCLVPLAITAQSYGTVAIGASLTAVARSSYWLSPSGDFAFGFKQVGAKEKELFMLFIWYAKIPEETLVWYPSRGGPRGGNPVEPVTRGSKLELTSEEGLVLTDPQGEQVWKSEGFTGAAAYGIMNDTGNFVLQGQNSERLWQSFDHPTGTLLPGQTLEVNGQLFTRQNVNNFSQGRFQLRLLQDGNMVLNTVDLVTKFAYDAYYWSNTVDSTNVQNRGYRVVFEDSGHIYILRRNGVRSNLSLTKPDTVPTAKGYHRVSLNFEGVLSRYFYQIEGSGNSWSVLWSEPDNICLSINGSGLGACGFNSICSIDDNRRKSCKCLQGYSLIDPTDEFAGCKPDFELRCPVDGQAGVEHLYDMVELPAVAWPKDFYENYTPYNEVDCKAACARDCLCAAALFRDDYCEKIKLPLSNGRSDKTLNSKAFVKVWKGGRPDYNFSNNSLEAKENQNGLVITVSALLGTSVFVNFMLISAFCIGFLFIYQRKQLKLQEAELETNVRTFSYKELQEATKNFKEELGSGAFGVVYKGRLKLGSSLTPVAIKRLDRLVRGTHDQCKDEEFKTEVKVIGQVHHKNLVRLLGICDEGEHRLLVYEFLSNGSLADFLFRDSKPSWDQRVQITCGIARGLVYLHEECSTKIMHCDIKPQNILLDDYYNARISDFGLAKLLKMDQTQTQTGIRGTRGYVAPEWFKSSPVTTKVDVYSFGVILLELICCRRNVDVEMGESVGAILTDLVCDCYEEGTAMEVVKDDVEAMNDVKTLERFMLVAIWCIQEDPSLRPSMRKVNQMLEGVVQLTLPPLPIKH